MLYWTLRLVSCIGLAPGPAHLEQMQASMDGSVPAPHSACDQSGIASGSGLHHVSRCGGTVIEYCSAS